MIALTDPAQELADACDLLIATNSNGSGDKAFCEALSVTSWSKEYFQAIFCLMDQADRIAAALEVQGIGIAFRDRAQGHLNGFKSAFSPSALKIGWDTMGSTRQILREHVGPIAMLSPAVSAVTRYPKLLDAEVSELLDDLDTLLEWLREHQLEDSDVLRAALIEGLMAYRFRLSRIEWLGWGYCFEALRSTIGAYLALERGVASESASPITQAAVRKCGEFFAKVYSCAGAATDAIDRVGTAIKLYGMVSMVRDGTPIVAAIAHHAS